MLPKILRNRKAILILSVTLALASFGIAIALHPATSPFNNHNPNRESNAANPSDNLNNAGIGDAVLYVYTSPHGTEQIATNTAGNYRVSPGITYCFEIDGITEYESTTINVWAHYENTTTYNILINSFSVGEKPSSIEFSWQIPTLPSDTAIKFKYGKKLTGPDPSWHFAKRAVEGSPPRLLLVIPEVFMGTLGAGTALFAGLGLRTLLKRKK